MITLPADRVVPTPPVPLPSTLGDAALAYAQAMLPVFPLRPREKVPLVKGGFYAATTDMRQIVAWWRRWPDANIGIPTGPASGWIALDIDPRNSGWAAFEALRNLAASAQVDLRETCCQKSGGGGIHLLFAFREQLGHPKKHGGMLHGYKGIDLKGQGGYLVMAPSCHPNGSLYQWLRTTPLMRFPDVLLPLAQTHFPVALAADTIAGWQRQQQRQEKCDPSALLKMALTYAHEGTRHRYALWLACRLVEAREPSDEAERLMRSYACLVPVGTHPFPEQEALACLAWAKRHVMASHSSPLSSGSWTHTSLSCISLERKETLL